MTLKKYQLENNNILLIILKWEKELLKNKALLENLFTLFVCVYSKIPLFIVEKPGCNKSLSVQLL